MDVNTGSNHTPKQAMDRLPPASKSPADRAATKPSSPDSADAEKDFVPERINVDMRRRQQRRGADSVAQHQSQAARPRRASLGNSAGGGKSNGGGRPRGTSFDAFEDISKALHDGDDAGRRIDASQNTSQFSKSVVFDAEIDLFDEAGRDNGDIKRGGVEISVVGEDGAPSANSGQSQVFDGSKEEPQGSTDAREELDTEQTELFDEIDDLFPHAHEGGDIVADPHTSMKSSSNGTTQSLTYSQTDSNASTLPICNVSGTGKIRHVEDTATAMSNLTSSHTFSSSLTNSNSHRSLTASLLAKSLRGGSLAGNESLLTSSSRDGLNEILAELDLSTRSDSTGRGEFLLDRSNRSNRRGNDAKPPTRNGEKDDVGAESGGSPCTTVPTVDWVSLTKSCKRAKSAFRDEDSGHVVVRNMFLTHLDDLIRGLDSYAEMYCDGSRQRRTEPQCTLNEIKAHTTQAKRALRFAMSCLLPPVADDDSKHLASHLGAGGASGRASMSKISSEDDGVERYEFGREYRQELQEAAVRGCTQGKKSNQRGLHIPLVKIIIADRSPLPTTYISDKGNDDDGKEHSSTIDVINHRQRAVRTIAARLLSNLVTDNALTSEIILRDVPFSPSSDVLERRMAGLILDARNKDFDDDDVISWSDLITATARAQGEGGVDDSERCNGNSVGSTNGRDSDDREALAAVSAALHNLLASLENREESLLELEEDGAEDGSHQDSSTVSELKASSHPIDVGFEITTNVHLINALLRHILPAKAVMLQAQFEMEHASVPSSSSRPQFKTPASVADDMSDSATEWISLLLERLASRSLLPNMLRSAGGTKSGHVTPEQVVLVSCIRQAVDDYHANLTPAGDAGGFGRRRLSIAAKLTGMAVSTRPHPLWGRVESRSAVPVLLALAHEVEEIRLRANELRYNKSTEAYDGELNCTVRIIDDICDILAQSLSRHASHNEIEYLRNKQCCLADARSVLGRETTLIKSCCTDLARILDTSLESNSGRKAREMKLSSQDQQTAIAMVRLIGNLVFQCCYNQDALRSTPIPKVDTTSPAISSNDIERTGLHVLLSATSISTAVFTLREWCIVAIRNAVENNDANAETVQRLEANEVMNGTPELQRMGVKVEIDEKTGKVQVKRRSDTDN